MDGDVADLLPWLSLVAVVALLALVGMAFVRIQRARREAERARDEAGRANTAKSEFVSRMSHELRTPLNAILGFGQLLEDSSHDEDDRESVEQILKAGRHLLALVDDLLDLSRIEAGTLTISLEPVHVAELLHDTAALIQPIADSRGIKVSTEEQGWCDVHVLTDRQRCRQVLLNLLSNAVKYNHDGGHVEVRCDRVGDETLRISVRDSGPGIDPVRSERLFQPFERSDESSRLGGTGLGLPLARGLVERLGGAIGVESTPGDGATFWIDMPVTEAAPEPGGPVAASNKPAATGPSRTLLLVEDNLANMRLVEAMLRRRPGMSVIPAMQGGLAIELAREHQPDVIVLDLHLPDIPGREVLNRLRADPLTRDIPVVIASADATPNRVRQLEEDGAFAYLTKPLDLQRFLDVLDAALAERDTVREHRQSTEDADG